jgi:hypothetical protein
MGLSSPERLADYSATVTAEASNEPRHVLMCVTNTLCALQENEDRSVLAEPAEPAATSNTHGPIWRQLQHSLQPAQLQTPFVTAL